MVVVVVAVVGGQLNVTLLFSLLVSNRNRWPWSQVLQVRDGLASVATNYRLSFPVRREIVSLILTGTLSGVSVSQSNQYGSVCSRSARSGGSESTGKPDSSFRVFLSVFLQIN